MTKLDEITDEKSCIEFTGKANGAFPFRIEYGSGSMIWTGLSKRELFAAMAMQGLMGFPGTINNKADKSIDDIAAIAVNTADALIAALKGGAK